MTSSYSKYINTPAPHAICVPHPRQTIPLHLNLTPVNIGHTQPVSPPPLHTVERLIRHVEEIPVLVPVAWDVMADALRDGHTESALCIALFYLKRHHILPQLLRALTDLLRAHSTVNDDEFISTVARTENLITFHLPDQCRDGTHTVIPRLMSVTVVVLLKVINIQNLKRQRFMFRKALFHDLF